MKTATVPLVGKIVVPLVDAHARSHVLVLHSTLLHGVTEKYFGFAE